MMRGLPGAMFGGLLALILLMVAPEHAQGNGGTVRVADREAGPYVVSVFTEPSPLVVGLVDVSVLVRTPDGQIVDGAQVSVTASKSGGEPGQTVTQPATRAAATNKLYYAAEFRINEPGQWRFTIDLSGATGHGVVAFDAEVEPASALNQPAALGLLVLVPVLVVAFWIWRSSNRHRA